MCLVAIAWNAHPRYPLVVAANRDEFHARASAPAGWWPEGFLGGRDLVAGGTWLGVRRDGRFALLTNVREPGRHDPASPSRGALVPLALAGNDDPGQIVARLLADAARYNGFNLVAGGADAIAWGSNRGGSTSARTVEPGVHGLSNAPLDAPWPKVVRLRDALARWCAEGRDDFAEVWSALADRSIAPDDALPSTGVSLEWERMLSASFIVSEHYGTRCSTVFRLDADGDARFVERSFDAAGRPAGEVDENFRITREPGVVG